MLFWLGCSAVDRFARSRLEMDVQWQAPLPVGRKILAANHPTTFDPFLMLTLTPEQVSILVTGDVFKIALFGRYLRAAGHIPVERANGRAAFDQARQLLQSDRTIGIFPEGSLSPLDEGIGFGRPRTGTARLALGTGAPIIPVGIYLPPERIRFVRGKIDDTPGVARLYLRGPYAVTVGGPMRFEGDVEDRALVRAVSERIMQRIVGLSHESRLRYQRSLTPEAMPRSRPAELVGIA
jgi:1-acyl-sn-glycerol-3-phosphate acyltransferase